MFDDKYIKEPKGIRLVSYYKEVTPKSLPCVFTHMHYHSDFEILYIVSGKAKMIVNSDVFIAESGSLILVNPYEVHYGEIISKDFSYYCVDFDISLISHEQEEMFLKEEIKYKNHITAIKAESYISSINEAYEKGFSGWKLKVQGCLMLLFAQLEKHITVAVPLKESQFAKELINYIEKNYSNSITSKDAAELLSYNQSYFCRAFKKCFSVNFGEYLNSFRIKKAKELLRSKNVSETAMLCGFSSISFFSSEFKKRCKITPGKYKNIYLDNNTEKLSRK